MKFKNQKSHLTWLYLYIPTFIISLWSIYLLIYRVFEYPNPYERGIATMFYYTTQSNLIVFVVLILYVCVNHLKRWFQYLAFVALIDITITGLIFHIFLKSYMPEMELMQHVLHTFVPIVYIVFYMFFIPMDFAKKLTWISLIHPLIYLLFIYTIVTPYFGHMLTQIFPDFTDAPYVYPFLNSNNYERGITGLIFFNLGVLTPLIFIISLLMFYLKKVTLNQLKR